MIGSAIQSLGPQLPRQIDVLRLYFNPSTRFSESDKISSIVRQIENRYRDGQIRVRSTESIRIKTKRLVASCKMFIAKRKFCSKSDAEKKRQLDFKEGIFTLFEVADTSEPLSLQQIEFLHDQRTSRLMEIHSIEPHAEPPYNEPGTSNRMQHEYTNIDSDMSNGYVSNESINSDISIHDHNSSRDSGDGSPDDSDPDYDPSEDPDNPRHKKPIPDECLTKISETKASYRICESLLKAGVELSGSDPNSFSLSKTSIWKQLTDLRAEQKKELLTSLTTGGKKIVIQFDGKKYKRLRERHVGSQERIIVLCHTEQNDIPLGLFPVESHSGVVCGTEILKAIKSNNLEDQVIAVASDTERVNTGELFGIVVYLEGKMKKDLLRLMCRHHIFEVVLKSVFELIFGATSGPCVTTFDILKDYWDDIKSQQFQYASVDPEMSDQMKVFADGATDILQKHTKHLRKDYAELNDLALKFLGIRTQKSFKAPGATNNARWMCRAIYGLKLFLFRDQIDELEPDFVESLERFCLFVSLIYVKYWNQSPNAADAPFNDMEFLKELDSYAQIDEPVAAKAIEAFSRHLWYLSDELILLSLFSNKVSTESKTNICNLIEHNVGERTNNSIRYREPIDNIQRLELHQFVSKRSLFLLHQLEVDLNFLEDDPTDWHTLASYRSAQKKIHDLLVVVNDSAERAIHLGINLIDGQKVQTEARLQDFIVSAYAKCR